jgi:hypothetical protein
MAKIIPSALIDSLNGSIDSVTFRKSVYGPVACRKMQPLKVASQVQLEHRAFISRMRAAWSTMTDAQRMGWNQLALQLQAGTFGNGKFPRRPYDLYLEFNYLQVVGGASIFLTAPPSFQTEAITNFQGTVTAFPLVLAATLLPTSPGNRYQQISISLGMRGRQRSAFTPWRVLAVRFDNVTLLNLTANYLAQYGNPVVGQMWRMKATIQKPGFFPSTSSIDEGFVP